MLVWVTFTLNYTYISTFTSSTQLITVTVITGVTCVTQCQRSSDCINGRCVRQGCNRVCENRLIDQVLPINPVIPGLPGLGCRDECRRTIECGVGAVCIRRGCRRVWLAGWLIKEVQQVKLLYYLYTDGYNLQIHIQIQVYTERTVNILCDTTFFEHILVKKSKE
jgi:hypothetical protein